MRVSSNEFQSEKLDHIYDGSSLIFTWIIRYSLKIALRLILYLQDSLRSELVLSVTLSTLRLDDVQMRADRLSL